MFTYYYILTQNYAKDCLKKLRKDRQGLTTVEVLIIVGIAAIILGLVFTFGKSIWEIIKQKISNIIN
jgi:Tfp pilus assembly protein FimT